LSIVSRRTRKVPARPLEFYGEGIPYLKDVDIRGRLIVIEGPDGSGRSTQIDMIISKLEADGHGVLNTGLKRSDLIKEGILQAKQMLPLGKRTLALFYAADFADQLEHKIIPALEAQLEGYGRSGLKICSDSLSKQISSSTSTLIRTSSSIE